MRGIVESRGPGQGLVTSICVASLLGGYAARASASDAAPPSIAAPSRRALEDEVPELKRARARARERLADPSCQGVLADFTDGAGRRLDLLLRARGRTPQEQLDSLGFESGLGRPGCSRGQLAFTQIASRVVSICLRPFTLLPPAKQEAVLIHEMLHTLGLGENPPESAAITARAGFRRPDAARARRRRPSQPPPGCPATRRGGRFRRPAPARAGACPARCPRSGAASAPG